MSRILLTLSLFCLTLFVTSSYAFSEDGVSIQKNIYRVKIVSYHAGEPVGFSGDISILTGFTSYFNYKMIRHREICTYENVKENQIHLTKYTYFVQEQWSV